MRNPRSRELSFSTFLGIVFVAFTLAACSGDDGKDGVDGAPGADGDDGIAGINCWDLNENGVADPNEDLNGDGVVDVLDCNALASGAYQTAQLHVGYFTQNTYDGTQSCLNCHGLLGEDLLDSAHFKWEGVSSNITGFEGDINGKTNLINNFCIAVPTNEGRCTHCHTGYGWADDTFAFNDPATVDCLICHDQSGTYKKVPTQAGAPDPNVDLDIVARSVALNGGKPTRQNCTFCHAFAGGGDNVKHGDIAMNLLDTTREYDVHMGTDGGNLDCVDCHKVMRVSGSDSPLVDHGIGGMAYHSVDDGDMQECTDCHGNQASIHVGTTVQPITDIHDTLACQVCHIPAIARFQSTKTAWYWEDAGLDADPNPPAEEPPRPTWDKKKGSFVWENNVRPELLYFDGKWDRFIIEKNDVYEELPVVLGAPSADYTTEGAMIYPFKKMVGNQPADVNSRTVLVPHLFGTAGGPNPFWGNYDWDLALTDGANRTGQEYTGEFEFVDTVMYLTVNHEVAPKEQAFGYNGACGDCHTAGLVDWTGLGWSDDPVLGGTRP